MTEAEIKELFIRAAETDHRLPDTARPARLKAHALPYRHSFADMNGWGAERLEEERERFWEARAQRIGAADIGDWERCNELVALIDDESERRCLWHWAIGKAGGRPFAAWCRKEERIHPETGSRRKNRAVAKIARILLHGPDAMETIDLSGLLAVEAGGGETDIEAVPKTYSWMDENAFCPTGVAELRDFSWADKRNQRRREKRRG
jgi:hypothetical protein